MSIAKIVEEKLCSACGGCYSVCTKSAIELTENEAGFIHPIVSSRCVECQLCEKVCPSNNNNLRQYQDLILGDTHNCYIGYATNESIRNNGQSGGVVSAILAYLLDRDKIDEAIVARFKGDSNRPHMNSIYDSTELSELSGSIYAQVPILKAMRETEHRYAITTLGCQSEAITEITKLTNIKKPDYVLGLVCEGQYSGKMIEDLADITEDEKLCFFRYKDKAAGGWPGNIHYNKSMNEYIKPSKERLLVKRVYENYRCIYCHDILNKNADVVFGDPWGVPEELIIDKEKGYTIFFARTDKGEKLIREASEAGYIATKQVDIKYIIETQAGADYKRKIKEACIWAINNNKVYPYGDNLKNKIQDLDVYIEKEGDISERLQYANRFYAEKKDLSKIIITKKRKEKIKYKIDEVKSFKARVLNYIRRKILK